MIRILSKNNYFWSNSQGVWHNKNLFWSNNTLEFDDEPIFEILDDTYIAICDLLGRIYILDIASQKVTNIINTKLEQIVNIVGSKNSNLFLITGLKRDEYNAYTGVAVLCNYKKIKKEYHAYNITGKYNMPIYLNEKENFFFYTSTNKGSTYYGKIYKYNYKLKNEIVLLENFCITDYFHYNRKTNHIIITQGNKVSLFNIKQNILILNKYFYIEDSHLVIISVNEFNDIFYIMLSDKIYTFNFETSENKILKHINIMESPIKFGSFSPECDFYVYIDDEDNLVTSKIK